MYFICELHEWFWYCDRCGKNLIVHIENVYKRFDECGKNFTQNIELKGHVTAINGKKD